MKPETVEYRAKREHLAQRPVYVAQPYHVVRSGLATEWPFTRGFASGTVQAASREYLVLLGRPSGNTQTVVPEEGQSSVGTFTLPLQDQHGEILRYLSNPRVELAHELPGTLTARPPYVEGRTSIGGYPAVGTLQLGPERIRYFRRDDATNRFLDLRWAVDGTAPQGHVAGSPIHNGEQLRAGQRIQLLAGYRDLDERLFLPFARMEVTGIGLSNDGVTYIVATADIQRFLRQVVFPATQDGMIEIEGHPLDVALRMLLSTGTAAVSTGTVQLLRPNVVVGTGTDFLTFIRPGEILVAAPFTAAERVLTVTSVESARRLYVTEPIDADSAAGLGYRRAGKAGRYDVFNGTWSVVAPRAFVDVAGLEALRDQRFPSTRMRFRLNAPEDGKEFLEREILKPLNLYPFVTPTGAYSARVSEGRAGAPVVTIDEDQIIGWTWEGGEDRIINQVEVQYDWNDGNAPNSFSLRQRYSALASMEKYGRRQPFKMASKGLRTDLGVQGQLDRWAFELFQRFSDAADRLQLIVRYGLHVVDVGETVAVTHARIPNRREGVRGLVAAPFQVRDVRPLFGAEGKVVMTLIHAGWDVIDQPLADPIELARTDLVIQRASYFNAAVEALGSPNVEEIVAAVTVTLQSPADTLLIEGKHFAATGSVTQTPTYTSRIRIGGLEGTILDATEPEGFVTAVDAKDGANWRAKRDNIIHLVLHRPNAVGPYTIVMTAVSGQATATSRNRSLVVTVRRP